MINWIKDSIDKTLSIDGNIAHWYHEGGDVIIDHTTVLTRGNKEIVAGITNNGMTVELGLGQDTVLVLNAF